MVKKTNIEILSISVKVRSRQIYSITKLGCHRAQQSRTWSPVSLKTTFKSLHLRTLRIRSIRQCRNLSKSTRTSTLKANLRRSNIELPLNCTTLAELSMTETFTKSCTTTTLLSSSLSTIFPFAAKSAWKGKCHLYTLSFTAWTRKPLNSSEFMYPTERQSPWRTTVIKSSLSLRVVS